MIAEDRIVRCSLRFSLPWVLWALRHVAFPCVNIYLFIFKSGFSHVYGNCIFTLSICPAFHPNIKFRSLIIKIEPGPERPDFARLHCRTASTSPAELEYITRYTSKFKFHDQSVFNVGLLGVSTSTSSFSFTRISVALCIGVRKKTITLPRKLIILI